MEPQTAPTSFLDPLTDSDKTALISKFFGDGHERYKPNPNGLYFQYYERELKRLRLGASKPTRAVTTLAVKTHSDILAVCDVLVKLRCQPKSLIRRAIQTIFPDAETLAIERTIDLTVRLWLMLNSHDEQLSLLNPQRLSIQWGSNQDLMDLVAKQFPMSTTTLAVRERRLSPAFTVANMVRLCNLRLEWTDSLETHLRLDRLSKTLWIFPFKDFLAAHLSLSRMEGDEQQVSIFPQPLLRETIITLNMLFPQWDSETQTLLAKHGQSFHSVGPFHGPRRLDLNEFTFWKDHLLELYEEVYLAPADSWRQLWVDRRHPHQYYTFWIALFVLFLSICSLVVSLIQTWATVKSLKLQTAGNGDN